MDMLGIHEPHPLRRRYQDEDSKGETEGGGKESSSQVMVQRCKRRAQVRTVSGAMQF